MASSFALDLRPAFSAFNQTAADAYQQQLDEDTLDALLEQQNETLNQQWSVLTELAELGMEGEIAAPLDVLLREWGRKKGYQIILDNFGMALGENEVQIIQERFWKALQKQHQALISELRAILIRGSEGRKAAEWERSERLMPHLTSLLKDQHDQASTWNLAAERILRDRELAIWEGQAIAHEWALRAADSMDKQQAGLDSQYSFAETVHGKVTEMLTPAHQQELAYQAANQYRSQERQSRIGCTLIGLAIAAAVMVIGVWLMFHIV